MKFFAPALLSLAVAIPALAEQTPAPTNFDAGFAKNLTTLSRAMESEHVEHLALNDQMSERWYDTYLKSLDPQKLYFDEADIKKLNGLRDQLDDYTLDNSLAPLQQMYSLYWQRMMERHDWIKTWLDQDLSQLDLNTKRELNVDREDIAWASSPEQLDQLWGDLLLNSVIAQRLTKKEFPEIKKTLLRRYDNIRADMIKQKPGDVFDGYARALTLAYDPHSSFLSERDYENFMISMSLKLEGIGAVLQQDGEFTKIVRVMDDGPADTSEKIHKNDRIVAVGQGKDGEMVDVIGWRLDDVVDLIRGESKSWVRVAVLPRDVDDRTKAQTVLMQRDRIQLKASAVTGQIIELKQHGENHKVGVITVPKFYHDRSSRNSNDKDYASASKDVQHQLKRLVDAGAEGIVMDLRNNGGGELYEANMMTDLFIEPGVVVQVKRANNAISRQNVARRPMYYGGPLVVLVNRYSASASEIFAGAIKDYKRGIIVGSTTFGKGTVQVLTELDKKNHLKVTESMFYRVNGESTQFRGVTPDIAMPSVIQKNDVGESSYDYALPYSSVRAVKHNYWLNTEGLIPALEKQHEQRVKGDPDFDYQAARIAWYLKQKDDTTVALNMTTRENEKEALESRSLALENKRRAANGKPIAKNFDELEEFNDKEIEAREDAKDELVNRFIEDDFILQEAGYILVDLKDKSDKGSLGHWTAE